MKLLITGFDPFGGESINPAWEAVKLIKDIEGVEIIKHQIPTVFKKSAESLFAKIDEVKPSVVLCIGQAGGRFDITPERVAINIDDARIPDNENSQPIDVPVYEDGENAYFSTLPIKAMVAEMTKRNIPGSVSNTAGTFVCNHILYSLLYYISKNKLDTKGGFIHVPYIPEQVITKKGQPYMEVSTIARGLEACIEAIRDNKEDLKLTGGKEF